MAEQLLLINPRRRKARKTTPARKRAKRRVVHHRRRTNPIAAAPRKRRVRRHHNPISNITRTHRRRSRKRNPIGSDIMGVAMPAFQGALGALGVELIVGNLPLPATLKSGIGSHITKSSAAVALGVIVNKLGLGRQLGNHMATGAMTVAFHDALKGVVNTAMPSLNLAGMGYYNAGDFIGYQDQAPAGLGMYVDGSQSAGSLGEMNEYLR
jgi:hypothetical protein